MLCPPSCGYLGVRVLSPFGIGHPGEARQSHVGDQAVVEDQEGQSLPIRRPPVSHVGLQDLLCLGEKSLIITSVMILMERLSLSIYGWFYDWTRPLSRLLCSDSVANMIQLLHFLFWVGCVVMVTAPSLQSAK